MEHLYRPLFSSIFTSLHSCSRALCSVRLYRKSIKTGRGWYWLTAISLPLRKQGWFPDVGWWNELNVNRHSVRMTLFYVQSSSVSPIMSLPLPNSISWLMKFQSIKKPVSAVVFMSLTAARCVPLCPSSLCQLSFQRWIDGERPQDENSQTVHIQSEDLSGKVEQSAQIQVWESWRHFPRL